MADAIISILAERVTAIIEDQIRYQVNLVRGVEKKVLDLSDKLEMVRNVLGDAEKRGVNGQSVKRWLKKFEDIAYEVDDILDEWNYALLMHKMKLVASPKHKVCCTFIPSSSCLCFKKVGVRRDTAIKIQNVKASLYEILKEKDDFNFLMSLPIADPLPKSLQIQSTSSTELENVYGLDIARNKNYIVKKLIFHGDGQIVSIVGMGGIGKTTLAQLVYNDSRVKDSFELRIWIYVSDPFDLGGIARAIVESVRKQILPPHIYQLEWVLEMLRDCIAGRTFLLVLDDVWTEDRNKWEPLKMNLTGGAKGSKILVTTRKEGVAKMMGTLSLWIYRPKQLSDDECWSLLSSISFTGRTDEECKKFEDMGKIIARKCNGLPLAANVLGSLLQFKDSLEEWENVSQSEIWELEKAEIELFPHLLLSYNELSPSLKRCFSYCALYPKDSRIKAERLIEEWMALGYLGSANGNARMEAKGREYFNNLAMRSLFQEFKRKNGDPGEQIEWCKMHDTVHDFALFLRKDNERAVAAGMTKRSCETCDPLFVSQVQECRSLVWGEKLPPNVCDCYTSVRVLRFEKKVFDTIPHGMEKLIHLRCLELVSGTLLSKEDLKMICKLYFLQTLLLASCSLQEIPDEIRNLVNLRQLNLSSIKDLKELPESICNLLELQTLNVEHCTGLCGLPEGIHRLHNLKHLLIADTPLSRYLPQVVAQLSGLQTLSLGSLLVGVGSDGYSKLILLKNLNRLTGSLHVKIHFSSSTSSSDLVEEAREAELRNKLHLQSLKVEFIDADYLKEWSPPSSMWIDVMEALKPYHTLEKLEIGGYMSSILPHWVSSPLNLLKKINLKSCRLQSLSAMGKLAFLEFLSMERMLELKVLGRDFLGIEYPASSSSSSSTNDVVVVVVAFPKLKSLSFDFCDGWSEWEDITAEEEESAAIKIMPCLTWLTVNWCRGLEKLPHRLLRKASSLKMLDISHTPELQKNYGDMDNPSRKSICRNNPKQLDVFWVEMMHLFSSPCTQKR